ncbi:MAG TPA: hypothetical protein DCX07_13765 [Phycisphaerales bacterium]|nr:hypothetical protein [Phycisphaerales bacterium]
MDIPVPEPDFNDPKELWAFFGLAFYSAQVLEGGLINLLVAVRHNGGHISFREIESLFSKWDRKTFGQVFEEIKKHISLSNDLEIELKKSLNIRNNLAHHFFVQHNVDLLSKTGRRKMILELVDTIEFLKKTDSKLDEVWQKEWERLGITKEMREIAIQEMYREAEGPNH